VINCTLIFRTQVSDILAVVMPTYCELCLVFEKHKFQLKKYTVYQFLKVLAVLASCFPVGRKEICVAVSLMPYELRLHIPL